MQIMTEFEKEGIKFALPTTTNYLKQDYHESSNFDPTMDVPQPRMK
jgi:hypothetical protein